MGACITGELMKSLSLWPQNTLKACINNTVKVYLTVQLHVYLKSYISASKWYSN